MIKIVKEHIAFHYLLTYITHRVKSIAQNMFRMRDNESIMCGFCCIACMEYMLAGKTLLDYTNLFSSKYFKDKYGRGNKC